MCCFSRLDRIAPLQVFEYLNCDLKKHMDDYGANDENRRRNNGNGIESPGLPETLVRVSPVDYLEYISYRKI